MNTFDLTLHAADRWQLAEHLRTVADRLAKAGPGCLPDAGEKKLMVFDGVEIGTIAQPEHKGDRYE